MKAYKIKDQVRHNIKAELCKHLVVRGGKYVIEIDPELWHEIFQTEKLNKIGINFDK